MAVRIRYGKVVRVLVLCVALLSVAACGNNPYPTDNGKIIIYTALGEDPKTLDPAQVSDTTSAEILTQIHDALYQNAYLDRPYKVEPALAAETLKLERTLSDLVNQACGLTPAEIDLMWKTATLAVYVAPSLAR